LRVLTLISVLNPFFRDEGHWNLFLLVRRVNPVNFIKIVRAVWEKAKKNHGILVVTKKLVQKKRTEI